MLLQSDHALKALSFKRMHLCSAHAYRNLDHKHLYLKFLKFYPITQLAWSKLHGINVLIKHFSPFSSQTLNFNLQIYRRRFNNKCLPRRGYAIMCATSAENRAWCGIEPVLIHRPTALSIRTISPVLNKHAPQLCSFPIGSESRRWHAYYRGNYGPSIPAHPRAEWSS